ncbi:hypothetical protein DV515_00016307 [Chloebia gouldiae]|uniref:Uncharacterized protein n=1 Tax=Chloebia gouldiae TaxID=44316 RepID=A0A3L8RSJ9_CHLGU|nr:hypothetical protein DV515_00016307 [Chloebia gouldiae]
MGESQLCPPLGKPAFARNHFPSLGVFLHSLETLPGSGHAGRTFPGVKPGVFPGALSPGKLCGAAVGDDSQEQLHNTTGGCPRTVGRRKSSAQSWRCQRKGIWIVPAGFMEGLELCQALAWSSGKGSSPRGCWHCPGSPGNGPGPEAARAAGAFGQRSRGCSGWGCWGVWAGTGAGDGDGETPPAELPQPWAQHREDLEPAEGWSSSAGRKGWQSWDCSPGEEKLWSDFTVAFLMGACKKEGEKKFPGALRDRKREDGSPLTESPGTGAQSSCGCPWIPGSAQGQAGQGWEQPGTVGGVPAMAGVTPRREHRQDFSCSEKPWLDLLEHLKGKEKSWLHSQLGTEVLQLSQVGKVVSESSCCPEALMALPSRNAELFPEPRAGSEHSPPELKCSPLEKLEHPGTLKLQCWRAEKGCQGAQRGGRLDKLGQGGAHWGTSSMGMKNILVYIPECSLLPRLGLQPAADWPQLAGRGAVQVMSPRRDLSQPQAPTLTVNSWHRQQLPIDPSKADWGQGVEGLGSCRGFRALSPSQPPQSEEPGIGSSSDSPSLQPGVVAGTWQAEAQFHHRAPLLCCREFVSVPRKGIKPRSRSSPSIQTEALFGSSSSIKGERFTGGWFNSQSPVSSEHAHVQLSQPDAEQTMPSGAGDQFKFPEPGSLTHSIVPVPLGISREWIFCHIPDPSSPSSRAGCHLLLCWSHGQEPCRGTRLTSSHPLHSTGMDPLAAGASCSPLGRGAGTPGLFVLIPVAHCRKGSLGSGSSNTELRVKPDWKDEENKVTDMAQVTQPQRGGRQTGLMTACLMAHMQILIAARAEASATPSTPGLAPALPVAPLRGLLENESPGRRAGSSPALLTICFSSPQTLLTGSLFQASCSVLELRSLLQGWDRDPDTLKQAMATKLEIPCSAFQQCQPIKNLLSAQELLSLGVQQEGVLGSPKHPGDTPPLCSPALLCPSQLCPAAVSPPGGPLWEGDTLMLSACFAGSVESEMPKLELPRVDKVPPEDPLEQTLPGWSCSSDNPCPGASCPFSLPLGFPEPRLFGCLWHIWAGEALLGSGCFHRPWDRWHGNLAAGGPSGFLPSRSLPQQQESRDVCSWDVSWQQDPEGGLSPSEKTPPHRVTKPYGVVTLGRCGRDRAAQADEIKEDELEPCSSCTAGSQLLLQAVPSGCPVASPVPLPEHLCFLRVSRDGITNCGMRSGVTTWKKIAGGQRDMVAPRAGWAAQGIYAPRPPPAAPCQGPAAAGARGRRMEGTGEGTDRATAVSPARRRRGEEPEEWGCVEGRGSRERQTNTSALSSKAPVGKRSDPRKLSPHGGGVTGREEGSQSHSWGQGGEGLESCRGFRAPKVRSLELVPPLIPPPCSQAWLVQLRAWDEEGITSRSQRQLQPPHLQPCRRSALPPSCSIPGLPSRWAGSEGEQPQARLCASRRREDEDDEAALSALPLPWLGGVSCRFSPQLRKLLHSQGGNGGFRVEKKSFVRAQSRGMQRDCPSLGSSFSHPRGAQQGSGGTPPEGPWLPQQLAEPAAHQGDEGSGAGPISTLKVTGGLSQVCVQSRLYGALSKAGLASDQGVAFAEGTLRAGLEALTFLFLPPQMQPPTSSDSFSSRLLGQILQLSLVKYPVSEAEAGEGVAKTSTLAVSGDFLPWIPGSSQGQVEWGLEHPGIVEGVPARDKKQTLSPVPQQAWAAGQEALGEARAPSVLWDSHQHPELPGLPPNRLGPEQHVQGLCSWEEHSMAFLQGAGETTVFVLGVVIIQEAPINPASKASKRKRDDVDLEQQESWFVVLERDLPEDDPEDCSCGGACRGFLPSPLFKGTGLGVPHSSPGFPFGRCPCKAAPLAFGQDWCVLPTLFLPQSLPLPLSPQPSELESDSDEYQSQNDTDLELEEQGGVTVLKLSAVQVSVPAPFLGTASVLGCQAAPGHQSWAARLPLSPWLQQEGAWGCSDLDSMNPLWILCCSDRVPVPHNPQGSVLPPEPGAEDPAVASSRGDAPDVASGDAQKPRGDGSSEQECDTACDTSSSQDGVRTLGTIPTSECGAGEVAQVPWMSPGSEPFPQVLVGWCWVCPVTQCQMSTSGTSDQGLCQQVGTSLSKLPALDILQQKIGRISLLDALLIPRKLLPWEVEGEGVAFAMGKISSFPGKLGSLTCAPGPSGAAVCLIPWDSCVPEGDLALQGVGLPGAPFPLVPPGEGFLRVPGRRGMALGLLECDGRGRTEGAERLGSTGAFHGAVPELGHPGCSLGWLNFSLYIDTRSQPLRKWGFWGLEKQAGIRKLPSARAAAWIKSQNLRLQREQLLPMWVREWEELRGVDPLLGACLEAVSGTSAWSWLCVGIHWDDNAPSAKMNHGTLQQGSLPLKEQKPSEGTEELSCPGWCLCPNTCGLQEGVGIQNPSEFEGSPWTPPCPSKIGFTALAREPALVPCASAPAGQGLDQAGLVFSQVVFSLGALAVGMKGKLGSLPGGQAAHMEEENGLEKQLQSCLPRSPPSPAPAGAWCPFWPSVGAGSAWRGAPSAEDGTGDLRGVTTELLQMLCAHEPCPFAEGWGLVHPRNAGLGLKGCLGPFSGAAAIGWDLCDASGTFGSSPRMESLSCPIPEVPLSIPSLPPFLCLLVFPAGAQGQQVVQPPWFSVGGCAQLILCCPWAQPWYHPGPDFEQISSLHLCTPWKSSVTPFPRARCFLPFPFLLLFLATFPCPSSRERWDWVRVGMVGTPQDAGPRAGLCSLLTSRACATKAGPIRAGAVAGWEGDRERKGGVNGDEETRLSKGDPDSRGAARTHGPSSLQRAQPCAEGAQGGLGVPGLAWGVAGVPQGWGSLAASPPRGWLCWSHGLGRLCSARGEQQLLLLSRLVMERGRSPIPTLPQGWKERFALSYEEQRTNCSSLSFQVMLGSEGGCAQLQPWHAGNTLLESSPCLFQPHLLCPTAPTVWKAKQESGNLCAWCGPSKTSRATSRRSRQVLLSFLKGFGSFQSQGTPSSRDWGDLGSLCVSCSASGGDPTPPGAVTCGSSSDNPSFIFPRVSSKNEGGSDLPQTQQVLQLQGTNICPHICSSPKVSRIQGEVPSPGCLGNDVVPFWGCSTGVDRDRAGAGSASLRDVQGGASPVSQVVLWSFAHAREGFASGLTLLPVGYLDLGAQRCLGPAKQHFTPEEGSSHVCNWEQMVPAVTEHSGHPQHLWTWNHPLRGLEICCVTLWENPAEQSWELSCASLPVSSQLKPTTDGSHPHPTEGKRDEVSAIESSCWCQCGTSWYLCPQGAFWWGVQRSPRGQSSCGCPWTPGSAEGQVGYWDLEQSGIMEGVPAMAWGKRHLWLVQDTKKGGHVDCHLSPPCCDTPFSPGTSLRAVDASLPRAGDSCSCCVPTSQPWEGEIEAGEAAGHCSVPKGPWLPQHPPLDAIAASRCSQHRPHPCRAQWDLGDSWQMTRDVAFGDTGGHGSGVCQPFRFCDFQPPAFHQKCLIRSSPQLRRLHAHTSHGNIPGFPREGRNPRPTSFISSKEQLLPPGFRFLMQFPAEAEHDLLTPTPALPHPQEGGGSSFAVFTQEHPNSPTLSIPESAVQTLLQLWQPRGRDHSLGSLGSASTLGGENLSLSSMPRPGTAPALAGLQELDLVGPQSFVHECPELLGLSRSCCGCVGGSDPSRGLCGCSGLFWLPLLFLRLVKSSQSFPWGWDPSLFSAQHPLGEDPFPGIWGAKGCPRDWDFILGLGRLREQPPCISPPCRQPRADVLPPAMLPWVLDDAPQHSSLFLSVRDNWGLPGASVGEALGRFMGRDQAEPCEGEQGQLSSMSAAHAQCGSSRGAAPHKHLQHPGWPLIQLQHQHLCTFQSQGSDPR